MPECTVCETFNGAHFGAVLPHALTTGAEQIEEDGGGLVGVSSAIVLRMSPGGSVKHQTYRDTIW